MIMITTSPDTITVVVKLFASLSNHGPPRAEIAIPFGSTVDTLLARLGLPVEGNYIILINSLPEWDRKHVLGMDDTIAIFPPIAGG
jgi:molybdopterin converting factor small subunit